MMDLSDRSLNDSSVVQAAQAFINEAMEGSDLPEEAPPVDAAPIEGEGSGEDGGMSKIREDGLALFKNICKLSMKFGTPDSPDDPMLLRGKVLSLELVRMVVDNAGPFWKTNEKYVPYQDGSDHRFLFYSDVPLTIFFRVIAAISLEQCK
jgi:brefeldin A-inhibited guanine nucleotide-exchange protein